jgi:LysM repeat protein
VLLVLALSALGQEVRVVDGRKYVVHTVQQGQTLYGISRHYAVPIDAITKANPAATQGLSLGQVLLIPQDAVQKKELKGAPQFGGSGELVHTVAKKETLFGIARKYGVEQTALLARNPDAANGLKEGMRLVIPPATAPDVPRVAAEPASDDKSTSHLVMPGETLFGLAQKYGVEVPEIEAANGGLAQGLKVGTYIRIPAPVLIAAPESAGPPSVKKEKYRVAFLLPFAIDANDSLMAKDPERKAYHEATEAAVQFYAGARIALDSMQALGLNAEVLVRDVGTDARTWGPVLKDQDVRDMDLYIGPFHRGAIEQLVKVSGDAHVVCPVPQSNKVLLGNPTVSKVVGGRPDQVQALARHAAAQHARDNIVLVRPDIPAEKELQDQLLRAVQEALARTPARARDSVLVARTGRRDVNALVNLLQAGRTNVVLAPSEDVEFVTALVSRLAGAAKDKEIIVYGMAAWEDMENVSATDMDKVHLRVPAGSFVDRTDPRVLHFVRTFRERYHDEPREYAYLGFDVTMYFLTALLNEGRGFAAHFDALGSEPLHMGFRMTRTGPENGYRNERVLILEHRDLGLHCIP